MGRAFLDRIRAPKRPLHGSFEDWLLDRELQACAKENGDSGGTEKFCECIELLLGEGKHQHRVPCPKHHDCGYVAARSALVSEAEKIANERVVVCPASEDQGRSQARWVKRFAAEMEKLAAPLLKQSGNGRRERKAI
jgi:hypothetical protein